MQLQSDEDSDHSDDLDLDYDVEIIAQQTAQSVTAKPAATLQAVIVGPPGAGPANNPVRTYKAPVAKANTKDIAIQKLNYNFWIALSLKLEVCWSKIILQNLKD